MASRKNDVDAAKLPRASSPYFIRPNSATQITSPNKTISGSRRRKDQKVKVIAKKSGKKRDRNVTSPRDAIERSSNNNDVSRDRNEEASKSKAADSRSVDSGSDVVSSHSGSNSHRSSYTDDTWSRDSMCEARQKRWARKEVRTLCKTVENKLTYLVNDGQRENNFSPLGVQVTTYKMMPYDVQYKILEAEMDKAERRKKKQNGEKNGKSRLISPTLNRQSTPLVLHTQIARITDYANEVFESIPVPNLALIHRYRPHSPDVIKSPEHGDVHNYNCHVGAALHAKDYVDFYLREGLQTGNREKSARLQRLRQKKKDEEKQTKEKRKNEAKTKSSADERQGTKSGQQKQNKASSRMYRETSFSNSVEGDEDRDSGRNSAMSRYSNQDSYKSSTSTPSRCQTSASQSQDDGSQPENNGSRSRSAGSRTENDSSNDSRSGRDDNESREDDSQADKADSTDNYSSNFDAEETSSTKERDTDSVSIHTYVSLEHANRTDGDKDLLAGNEDYPK